MADTAAKTTRQRKTGTASEGEPIAADSARQAGNAGATSGDADNRTNRDEAKSRFNAALEEAKAGAAALGAEAKEKVGSYRSQASAKSGDLAGEAKTAATRLAQDGKSKASEALTSLSRVVEDNAPIIDENLGPKYGEYVRGASRALQETAVSLEQKSLEELGDDAREFVRRSPGTAVGLAALAGYCLARLLRR